MSAAGRDSASYAFRFAAAVCVACSLLISTAATVLRPRQQANERLDVQRNILRAAGLGGLAPGAGPEELRALFESRIQGVVVDEEGRLVPGLAPADLDPKDPGGLLPFYVSRDERGAVGSYCLPVSGMGLWSTLHGYLALEPDAATVRGLTFYKHGETPGLGGEVEKDWFQANFKGKSILDREGRLVSVAVAKGKVAERIPERDRPHYVDGISGATMTGKGLTAFLKEDLAAYEPLLRRIRDGSSELSP